MLIETNPIVELAKLSQRQLGGNIESKVIKVNGEPHRPTITAEIKLPNGNTYLGTGKNKRLAKRKAAKAALEQFGLSDSRQMTTLSQGKNLIDEVQQLKTFKYID